MSEEGIGNASSVYIYNGVDEVPMDVTQVRVDPSVTVIPDNAFYGRRPFADIEVCRQLEQIDLPEGLIRIGESAFCFCQNLKRINIPSTVVEIGYNAFYCCKSLKDVVLPANFRQMGNYAFHNCRSLQRINFSLPILN